jgi:hypothetical protein
MTALVLRRARVVEAEPADGPEQRLTVEREDGTRTTAVVDVGLHGAAETGDELVVNAQAVDLRLGSGGFDVVHVNLTRGLAGTGVEGAHVMKLNYTSLQHAVHPVEAEHVVLPLAGAVGVFSLHGQLAPMAWAFRQALPDGVLGYVQTVGGALPGGHSKLVRRLRDEGLLAGHITAAPTFGGDEEAITTAGGIAHGLNVHGWDAALAGPGPGILGSGSRLGHGGLAALDSAHAALALGAPVVLCARMSSGDPRERHLGLSHHTTTVLQLLLRRVTVAIPPGEPAEAIEALGHHWRELPVDLHGYAASGLPATTMGRSLDEDPLFFAAALAAGTALADAVRGTDEDDVR